MRPTDRVIHRNAGRSYGSGNIVAIVSSAVRPPSKAKVQFDGEPCPRVVWLDDLTLIVTPRPLPGSTATLRLVYPPERFGEPVAPVVA